MKQVAENNPVALPFAAPSRQPLFVDRALLLVMALLLLSPLVLSSHVVGELTRAMIYGMAACAVGFAIRHGGLVSFGHAAFFGLGAYTIIVAQQAGFNEALVVWPLAVVTVSLAALIIGWLSLRTRGVGFIMITLGFAQMVYFVVSSIQGLGAADGLALASRNKVGNLSIEATVNLHYITFALLCLVLFTLQRLSRAPFGLSLRGVAQDERRMRALGFAPGRLQILSFVLSAAVTGLAGALAANFYYFASPSYLHWVVSGELLVMVALGGIGALSGGLFGALVLILCEMVLAEYTTYWRIILGPMVVLAVLFLRQGLHPALQRLLGGRND